MAGISIITNDGYNENEMLETAMSALKVAETRNIKASLLLWRY